MTDRVTKRSGTATGQKARRAVRRDTVDEDIPRSATEDVQATAAPRHGMESSGVGETGIANVVNNIMQAVSHTKQTSYQADTTDIIQTSILDIFNSTNALSS
jgi:hypothetical protein